MKHKYRTIGILVSFLFVAGLFFAGYLLYKFPVYYTGILRSNGNIQTHLLDNKINLLRLVVGFTGFLGIIDIAIWMLAFQNQADMYSIQIQNQKTVSDKKNQSSLKESVAETIDNDIVNQRLESFKNITDGNKKEKVLSIICKEMEASQAAYYRVVEEGNKKLLKFDTGYAYYLPDSQPIMYEFGEGLPGQVAKEGKLVIIDAVPEGYINILSGLGKALPSTLLIAPVYFGGDLSGILEIASFHSFSKTDEGFVTAAVNYIENL